MSNVDFFNGTYNNICIKTGKTAHKQFFKLVHLYFLLQIFAEVTI